MINRYFTAGIHLSLILILQLTLVELISFQNFKPDLIMIGLIYFTLRFGQIPGVIAAFFVGLFFDILSNGIIGASSLSKVIACFIAGYFSDQDSERVEISINFFVIVFFITVIEKIIYIFVAVNLDFKYLLIYLVNFGLIPSVVTLIFSLLILLFPKEKELR